MKKTYEPADPNELRQKQAIAQAQSVMQTWLNRGLWLVIIVLAVFAFVNWRNRSAESARLTATQALTQVEQVVYQLQSGVLSGFPVDMMPPETRASRVSSTLSELSTLIDQVLSLTTDQAIVSAAIVTRGDLNFAVAVLTDPPAATTRPALSLDAGDPGRLDIAKRSWQSVIANFPKQTVSVARSRMGLAALAEEARKLDEAKEHYQSVVDDTASPKAMVDLAKQRLLILPKLGAVVKVPEEPVPTPLLTENAAATTQPAEQPAITTQPTTQP